MRTDATQIPFTFSDLMITCESGVRDGGGGESTGKEMKASLIK